MSRCRRQTSSSNDSGCEECKRILRINVVNVSQEVLEEDQDGIQR